MRRNTTQGYTLIELLIAMTISSMVLGAAVNTLLSQRRLYARQDQSVEMTQVTRAAMELVTRDMRMAGFDPANIGFDGVAYDPDHLQIRADLNGDGDTDDAHETIVYAYHSASRRILRDTGGGDQPIADNIEAFTFDYLDGAGNSTTMTDAIRQIRIAITTRAAKPDPHHNANGGHRIYRLTSLVTPKNLALE